MDGYDIVANYFKEWVETQDFIDYRYVAIFEAKRKNEKEYSHFQELIEYEYFNEIIFDMDWCEGEDDIINLRFYSLDELCTIVEDAENHALNNTARKWYNRKVVK